MIPATVIENNRFKDKRQKLADHFERVFQRLLSGEQPDLYAEDVSSSFEVIAAHLFAETLVAKSFWYDGVDSLTASVRKPCQVEFTGEMWVGDDRTQWKEDFRATVTDKRITKQGVWITLWIGSHRAEGDLLSAFKSSSKFQMPNFSIGESKSERLSVQVISRCHPHANDYWDGNWVDVLIQIATGSFKGAFGACLRSEDFVHLAQGLTALYSNLSAGYTFTTMEEQLAFTIQGDGRGHFEIKGRAQDRAGDGNELRFTLNIDQTFLAPILIELEDIIKAFPVVGSPEEK